uniref:AI-2E family transporter n=1 Tax=Solibacter usitatus (strain Ellin6076) TaxID=234267 RepID=Q023I3_SOLUE
MQRIQYESAPRLPPVVAVLLAIAALYFAREILVPLAVAVLLSFLLTPSVRFLERLRIGRLPSVLLVFLVSLACAGGVGYVVGNQLFDVLNELPKYKENLRTKMESLGGRPGGSLAKATASVQELSKELAAPKQDVPETPRRLSKTQKSAAPPAEVGKPVPVELVEPPPNALQSVRNIAGPLLAPIGKIVVIVIFTIVILIKREDLRNRVLRLLGRGRLPRATQAFDDAAERVTQYLRMQFLVNSVFGATIGVGLSVIGLPSALLWGALAGLLRFMPYLGPILGGALPSVMALAVFPGWRYPLMCLGLFLITELVVAYAVEPWLYGTHTGVSSLAILVSAAFWTTVWGPVGLVLSTPLTVCLLVLGRHAPQLEFLYVILGDEPVLEPEAELYQRLLALDQQEAQAVLDRAADGKTPLEIYDGILVPSLRLSEEDRHRGGLDTDRENFILQSMNEFIAGMASEHEDEIAGTDAGQRVLCLPAGDPADEITALMLCHALQLAGIPAVPLPRADLPGDSFANVKVEAADVICICALAPFALMSARTLSRRMRKRFPRQRILVGLWSRSGESEDFEQRLAKAFDVQVVTTLSDAMERLTTSPAIATLSGD